MMAARRSHAAPCLLWLLLFERFRVKGVDESVEADDGVGSRRFPTPIVDSGTTQVFKFHGKLPAILLGPIPARILAGMYGEDHRFNILGSWTLGLFILLGDVCDGCAS